MKFKSLASRLNKMAWVDQKTIWAAEPFNQVRDRHCDEMKRIVARYGWPTISKVGNVASGNAWLLVQHCDHDVNFQKKCLALIKKEAKNGEVVMRYEALLEDRVRKNMKKPQIYGTQVIGAVKNVKSYKIEKPNEVDERRKKMGLVPLKDYLNLIRKMNRAWGGSKPKPTQLCPCGSGKQYKKCHGI